jgi:CRP/FNR family transcriptional regulator, cyclic AMP receptor protein
MIQQSAQAGTFKQQLRESLRRDSLNSHAVKIARHDNVYTCGDQDKMIYFIESGQIKLLMLSPEGKECLLAIHAAGDIFGELCLSGSGSRLETATAMEETILRQIPSSQFLARLSRDSLLAGFVRYLAGRIADQQRVIANMVTVDSEQRLGKTLMQLARTLGKKEPRGLRIELKISHEELSEMVGTTRPRITLFIQRFQDLGLIERICRRSLIVQEEKLTSYLAVRAAGHVWPLHNHSFQKRQYDRRLRRQLRRPLELQRADRSGRVRRLSPPAACFTAARTAC